MVSNSAVTVCIAPQLFPYCPAVSVITFVPPVFIPGIALIGLGIGLDEGLAPGIGMFIPGMFIVGDAAG